RRRRDRAIDEHPSRRHGNGNQLEDAAARGMTAEIAEKKSTAETAEAAETICRLFFAKSTAETAEVAEHICRVVSAISARSAVALWGQGSRIRGRAGPGVTWGARQRGGCC